VLADLRAGLAFRRDLAGFLRERAGPDVIRVRAGRLDVAVAMHPDAIHRVLVAEADRYGEGLLTRRRRRVLGDCLITREGTAHRERRALLQPGFARRRLAESAPAVVARAARTPAGWRSGAEGALARLALCATGDALLGVDLEPDAPALVPALTALATIPDAWPSWRTWRRVAAARRVVDSVLVPRLRAGHGSVLGLLRGLEERAARDEAVALLIAGMATTARALADTRRLLAAHPAVEEAVGAEVDEALDGRPPGADDVARLPRLDRVLREVLRLHPPVGFMDRRPLEDVELQGERVRAGALVLVSPLLRQRDPRLYDRPDAFRPERWANGETADLPRYAWFPFGGGPHACIGQGLARLQLPLIVATLMTRARPA
jgi:cytochrome P450